MDENMEKFYQAENHNCSDFEMKCLSRHDSTDDDMTLFVHAKRKEKQKSKYFKLKKKESKRKENVATDGKYHGLKIKTKRKRHYCPFPTVAFCFCWLLLVVITFATLIKFTKPGIFPMSKIKSSYTKPKEENTDQETTFKSCDDFAVETVWASTYQNVISESAIRLIDVNRDGADDIIIGFYSYEGNITSSACDLLNDTLPCDGGAIAIDGRTGKELWKHYRKGSVFAINCNADLNSDGVPDCLLGGRAAVFVAISGEDGNTIWSFSDEAVRDTGMNVYTAQFVRDFDNDGVMEVLQMHGGEIYADPFSKKRKAARILLLSGKTGKVLRWTETPNGEESYFSPVVYTLSNGTEMVVFGTGGETHGGALYVIQLLHLYLGKMESARPIYVGQSKGTINPPVLVDLTKDGTVDMVIAFFNTTIAAIDGESFQLIWSYSVPNSETYSIPAPGYYNDDDTIDFLIRTNIGPGFPVYYKSMTSIVDGRTGKLISKPWNTSVAVHDSPLSISMEGKGHDLFVFWMTDCLLHEGQGGEYSTTVLGRFDTCKLRFNTKEVTRFCIRNADMESHCKAILQTDVLGGDLNVPANEKFEARGKRHMKDIDGKLKEEELVTWIVGTGALTDSIKHRQGKQQGESKDSIDVVVAAVWHPVTGRGILKSDMQCIEKYNKEHGINVTSPMEDHRIQYSAKSHGFLFCTKDELNGRRMHQSKGLDDSRGDTSKPSSRTTVYRVRLSCVCNKQDKNKRCAKFLPLDNQRWAGYMGSFGNGFLNERNHKS